MSAAKAKAQKLINENGVIVFSKSYCPYCKASKDLLTKLGAQYEVLELDLIGTWKCLRCVFFFFFVGGNLLSFARGTGLFSDLTAEIRITRFNPFVAQC